MDYLYFTKLCTKLNSIRLKLSILIHDNFIKTFLFIILKYLISCFERCSIDTVYH